MAILLPNCIEVVVAIMSASRIGAVYSIFNWDVKPSQLDYLLEDLGASLLITTPARAESIRVPATTRVLTIGEEWAEAVNCAGACPAFSRISSDLASLIYTSGSTGRPKAVISAHCNVTFATWAIQQRLAIRESDVIGNFLPLSFDYGLYQGYLAFQAGATLALGTEEQAGAALLGYVRKWQITGLPLVPHMATTLVRLCNRSREGRHRSASSPTRGPDWARASCGSSVRR